MALLDQRHRYIANKVREAFDLDDLAVVEHFILSENVFPVVNGLLQGGDPSKIIFTCSFLQDGTVGKYIPLCTFLLL